jgi:hypothetical protein
MKVYVLKKFYTLREKKQFWSVWENLPTKIRNYINSSA